MMEHVAKDGSHKIVDECTLPYTGRGVVAPDHHRPRRASTSPPTGWSCASSRPGVTVDEVRAATEPELLVSTDRPARPRSHPGAPYDTRGTHEWIDAGSSRRRGVDGQRQPGTRTSATVIGLVTFGLVHLVVGWIALQLAFGQRPAGRSADQQGALRQASPAPRSGLGAAVGRSCRPVRPGAAVAARARPPGATAGSRKDSRRTRQARSPRSARPRSTCFSGSAPPG